MTHMAQNILPEHRCYIHSLPRSWRESQNMYLSPSSKLPDKKIEARLNAWRQTDQRQTDHDRPTEGQAQICTYEH